jgi:hypothetical protein
VRRFFDRFILGLLVSMPLVVVVARSGFRTSRAPAVSRTLTAAEIEELKELMKEAGDCRSLIGEPAAAHSRLLDLAGTRRELEDGRTLYGFVEGNRFEWPEHEGSANGFAIFVEKTADGCGRIVEAYRPCRCY